MKQGDTILSYEEEDDDDDDVDDDDDDDDDGHPDHTKAEGFMYNHSIRVSVNGNNFVQRTA